MKLFVNLDTRQIISTPRKRTPIKEILFSCGDIATIDVAFVTHGKQIAIAANEIKLAAYKGLAERTPLVSAVSPEVIGRGSTAIYRFNQVSFGGSSLLALLGSQKEITLTFEVRAQIACEDIVTEPIKIVISQSANL